MIHFYKFQHFVAKSSLLHGISKKNTIFPYHFSLAMHTGEDYDSILQNRHTLANLFTSDENYTYIVAQQTHSDHIEVITSSDTKGWETQKDAINMCDALITNLSKVVLTILTADCVPILLYDKQTKVVAAVHAGWKGTQSNILYKTVQKMIKYFGSDPINIFVGIGPSIGKCCYEVGEDVAMHFKNDIQSCTSIDDKYMLDLPNINKKQLLAIGIPEKNIEMSNICTSCETKTFFSYRKEQGCTGRFMSMIALK